VVVLAALLVRLLAQKIRLLVFLPHGMLVALTLPTNGVLVSVQQVVWPVVVLANLLARLLDKQAPVLQPQPSLLVQLILRLLLLKAVLSRQLLT
jgi:hypothetical protein